MVNLIVGPQIFNNPDPFHIGPKVRAEEKQGLRISIRSLNHQRTSLRILTSSANRYLWWEAVTHPLNIRRQRSVRFNGEVTSKPRCLGHFN